MCDDPDRFSVMMISRNLKAVQLLHPSDVTVLRRLTGSGYGILCGPDCSECILVMVQAGRGVADFLSTGTMMAVLRQEGRAVCVSEMRRNVNNNMS